MRAGRRGFSLMEVIVAMTILATGSLMVGQLFSGQVRILEADEATQGLIERAENLLREARHESRFDYDTVEKGESGRWSWTVNGRLYRPFEQDLPEKPPLPRLVEIQVSVKDSRTGRDFALTGLKQVDKETRIR